jgi:hypothetical protein
MLRVLLRFAESGVAFEIDRVDPQFLPLIFIGEDFEEHLVHSLFPEEHVMTSMFPGGIHRWEWWCSVARGIRGVRS